MDTRLQQFLAAENLTQAKFATTLNVAPASVSHILQGRNKPSFDFLVSMTERFPDLNVDWLLTGKGKMYKSKNSATKTEQELPHRDFADDTIFSFDDSVEESSSPAFNEEKPVNRYEKPYDPFETATNPLPPVTKSPAKEQIRTSASSAGRHISKIIVFYSDSSFEELQ